MEKTSDFLAAIGCPIDGEDPTFWDEVFGDNKPPEPRRFSTAKAPGRGPFRSWEDFLARTSEAERMRWCAQKAKVANRPRLVSGRPEVQISAEEVWEVLSKAQGRCCHCGSLALERRPSDPRTGAPRPWEHVARRIGSLEHVKSRFDGGINSAGNLAWACLWCNTWPQERRPGALDHGGYYPVRRGGPRRRLARSSSPAPARSQRSRRRSGGRRRRRASAPAGR